MLRQQGGTLPSNRPPANLPPVSTASEKRAKLVCQSAHRPRPSKQPATPEIFRLGLGYPLFKAYKADWKIGALGQWLAT
jgi:hypothetical protein